LLLRPSVVSGKSFDDFAGSKLSREQWAQRVDEARCRLEEFVANTRIQGMTSRPSADHQKTEAVERAMRNPSLLRGDIVATGKASSFSPAVAKGNGRSTLSQLPTQKV
jgi:hypothetical protein